VFTLGSQALKVNGTVSSSVTVSGSTLSINVVETDLSNNTTYWQNDITFVLTGSSMTVVGRYYHPTHGYVNITTVVPLTVSSLTGQPTAGQLLFTGSNGSKARLTFNATGYVIEVDTTGTGTFAVVP
jgi:hypothetical protein